MEHIPLDKLKLYLSDNVLHVLSFIGIILLTIFIASAINHFFRRLIQRSTAVMKNDPTNYHFLRHTIIAIIYIVGFSTAIYKIPSLKALANSLLAGAGILAVAIGFAAQHAFGNVISGIFVIIFKPFRINDRLKIRDLTGVVEDITLRHTVIRDFENRRIIIPNTVISDEIIINSDFEDGKICKWIDIGISYDSNIDLARNIIKEEILSHPLHIDPRNPQQIIDNEELVPVRVLRLDDSAVLLRAWAWTQNAADSLAMSYDLYESVKKRFDEEGVEIPFPHRTVVLKNDDSLTRGTE